MVHLAGGARVPWSGYRGVVAAADARPRRGPAEGLGAPGPAQEEVAQEQVQGLRNQIFKKKRFIHIHKDT